MDSAPMPRIAEVPIKEVLDSPRNSQHSNDSNIHIAPEEYEYTTEHEFSDYPEEFIENDSEYVGDSEYAENECDGVETDDPEADYPDRPNFQEILALQGQLNFGSEENVVRNNYDRHPNQYLPEYNISENNSQAGEENNAENEVDDDYDDYNGNYSADNIARDDDDDVIYYGFPRAPAAPAMGPPKLVAQDLAGNAYLSDYEPVGASVMDDMSVSMGGYNSTNASTSDISGLCEIEDSEANLSDNDDQDSQSAHLLQSNSHLTTQVWQSNTGLTPEILVWQTADQSRH